MRLLLLASPTGRRSGPVRAAGPPGRRIRLRPGGQVVRHRVAVEELRGKPFYQRRVGAAAGPCDAGADRTARAHDLCIVGPGGLFVLGECPVQRGNRGVLVMRCRWRLR